MKRLRELREKRANLVQQSRAILDKAEAEKRALTGEEQTEYDRLFAEQERFGNDVQREERQLEAERTALGARPTEGAGAGENRGGQGAENRGPRSTPEYRAAFDRFLRGGIDACSADERRALQADVDTQGGYVVPPVQFVETLIKTVDDLVFMRGLATKETVTTAASLGSPTLEADPADADWTPEIKTGSEDSSMAFGRRDWNPHPLAKRIKVSNKLIRLRPNVEGLVIARLGYKFAISQEKAFLLGSGAQQPLGVFVANANGVPTSRDVQTGSATDFTMDGLIDAKYNLKAQYWAKASWLFHRTGVQKIAKLKDSTNNYLWQPSVQAGQPDRLLNFPMAVSEYVPNTFTTGLYVGMLADFSNYWIVDALDMQLQRLSELYAETNQTGYIGRLETDGQPALAEAFVRLKTN